MKKICSILIILICCLIFSSCKEEKPKDIRVNLPFEETVKIVVCHNMGSMINDNLFYDFDGSNPLFKNITIEFKDYTGSDEDFRKSVMDDKEVNVVLCDMNNIKYFQSQNKLVGLDDYIALKDSDGNGGIVGLTKNQQSDYISSLYDACKSFGDDKMYALPFLSTTEVMYYNKTFFESNNLPVPTHWFSKNASDTTSLESVCRLIKQINPNCTPLSLDSEFILFSDLMNQSGYDFISDKTPFYRFNNDNTITLLTKLKDFYDKGYIRTPLTASDGNYLSSSLNSEISYITIASVKSASHLKPKHVDRPVSDEPIYKYEADVAMIPQIDENNQKVFAQGYCVAVLSSGDVKKDMAAWLYVKYLTNHDDLQAKCAMYTSNIPARKSVATGPIISSYTIYGDGYDNLNRLATKVACENVDALYSIPVSCTTSAIATMNKMVSDVLKGVTTPANAINDVCNQLNN